MIVPFWRFAIGCCKKRAQIGKEGCPLIYRIEIASQSPLMFPDLSASESVA